MKKVLVMMGMVVCAVGSLLFGNAMQEMQIDEALEERMNKEEEEDDNDEETPE